MISFGALQNRFGKCLRAVLSLLPRRMTIPILQGRARGKWWKKESGDNGYWLGSYEADKQRLFSESIRKGDVVYDIGAQAGFYTLVACSCGASVYSFEPEIRNYGWLREHIAMNKMDAIPLNVAICDRDGTQRLKYGRSVTTHKLSADGEVEVTCRTMDSLVAREEVRPPHVIKMDIEGSEYKALLGMKQTLLKYHPILFIEVAEPNTPKVLSFLEELGYSTGKISGGEYVFRPR
jgi:FkbM family methyltransferase